MERTVISLLFGAVICFATVESESLSVKFGNKGPILARIDSKLEFNCSINKDGFYVLKTNAQIIKVHNGEEVVLSKAGNLEDGFPVYYSADIDPKTDETIMFLNILKVRDEDDGYLVCRVEHHTLGEKEEDKIEIIVQRPIDSLKLKINDKVFTNSMVEPFELDSGTHDFSCISEGSNPAVTDIQIFLHGKKVSNEDPVSELISGDLRKYRTTISTRLDIASSQTGEDLECTAKSSLNDSFTIKFPISVRVYEPEILCNDSYAKLGQMNHIIMCTVNHQDSKLKLFKYYINNEEVRAGQQSSDFNDVTKEDVSPGQTVVKLRLNKVTEDSFDDTYQLVLEHQDGHISRKFISLHQTAGDADEGNSSKFLFASLATVLLCVISVTLSWA